MHTNSPSKNIKLSKEETKEDLKVLRYALKKSYAGHYFAPGVNMKEFYRQLRKYTKRNSREKFLKRLQALFATLPDQNIQALDFIEKEESGKTTPWNLKSVTLNQDKGLYLKVSQFSSLNSPYWDKFQETFQTKMKNSKFLILDLRNSKGEDDSVGIFLARYFNGGVLRHPIIRQHHIRTKESLRLLKNYWSLKNPDSKFPFPEYRKGEAKILPIEFKRDTQHYSKKYSPNKDLYLIVDETCEKPCETTLYALEKNPKAKIIGSKTQGKIHFGHPGILLLPNSKISILIPTSYNEFADGRFEEKRGFTPSYDCQKKPESGDKQLEQLCEMYW